MDRYSVLFDSFEYSMGHWTEMNYEDQRHFFFHFQIKWNTVYNLDVLSIITLVLIMTITITININNCKNAKNEVFSYSMCWHKGEKVQKPEDLHTMSSILRSKAL